MLRLVLSLIAFIVLVSMISTGGTATRKNFDNFSQDGIWKEADDSALSQRGLERQIIPQAYKTFRLNKDVLKVVLESAPMEFTASGKISNVILTLPMPDGSFAKFRIQESPIMAAKLAAKYPDIKTYSGQGIDNPTATTRFDLTPEGFHAMILSTDGTIYINPYAKGDMENYISYNKRNLERQTDFVCHFDENETHLKSSELNNTRDIEVTSGTTLRTYRLALATTAEYTNVFRQAGDTDAQAKARALAAMTTSMNRVNGIYERDLSIRMTLIANTDLLIYTNSTTDPYSNGSGGTMLGQNQTNIDSVIGSANYDIGHVFSTGGGGVANLNVPCTASKARGVTGSSSPFGDGFDVDYVAHEMGHQFGARHTFNGATGNCSSGNRSASAAYEPGSGITIMAYAGICGGQNLAANSIDTFHVKSLEEIVAFVTTGAGTCSVNTATGNTPPTITGSANFTIPKNTPFSLTASATDVNGDSLTYDWQEYDLGASTTAIPNTDSDGTTRPIFRPYLPTMSVTRVFPAIQYVLNNANVPPSTTSGFLTGELLPAISRTMTFQVVVRDNHANGGGINSATNTVTVNAASGPFLVTAPNTNVSWSGGTNQTVTWDVANTTASPVSSANVRILFSNDGGQTFPTVLSASTANDGSESITVPNVSTTTARIKIEAVGNIFFDISDANFTVTNGAPRAKHADFDGDGKTDISVFRPSTNVWWVQQSSNAFVTAFMFGASTDKLVPADYDGDGKTDAAVWRPSTGAWFVLRSSNSTFFSAPFGSGALGDIPAPGDFDGDNKADLTVYRPSAGTWFTQQSTGGVVFTAFGNSTDIPVVADYDNDGKSDVAIYRPTGGSGSGEWWILRSTAGLFATPFGSATDKPVQGDYTGDGKADAAFWRPSDGNWYVLRSEDLTFFSAPFGVSTDTPAPGDYDGDGKYDFGIFRSSNSTWFIQRTTGGVVIQPFGTTGDKPVPSAYVP